MDELFNGLEYVRAYKDDLLIISNSHCEEYNKPVAFNRKNINYAHVNYTTRERKLLSNVKTLKEIRNILLGQQIKVCIDHNNLT